MDINWLSVLAVGSFAFVSFALGIKWLGDVIIQYKLAKSGIEIMRHIEQEEDHEQ